MKSLIASSNNGAGNKTGEWIKIESWNGYRGIKIYEKTGFHLYHVYTSRIAGEKKDPREI